MPDRRSCAALSRACFASLAVAALAAVCANASHAASNAYVPNDDGTVSVISLKSASVVKTILVGNSPVGIAVSANGRRAYVTNADDNTVSVITTRKGKVIATIPVGTDPEGIAVAPDNATLYVVNNQSSSVSVVAAKTNKVIGTIAVGLLPLGVVFNPAGTRAYVANNGNTNTVSVIDTATRTVVGSIPIGGASGAGPAMLAIDPTGNPLYASKLADDAVLVIC